MKASLKGRLEKSGTAAAATATIAFNAADVKLRASLMDATVVNGPSLKGLALAVEKPGFFIVDYNVPDKDFRFQFMNSVKIADKPLNFTYTHSRGDNKSMLDGTLVLDSANNISVNHIVGTGNWKLKYNYVHGGVTIFEPSYDVAKTSWDFAVSRKVYNDDVFRATYETSTQVLGLVWSRNSKIGGCLKISASVNLTEESKVPKLVAESTWNLDM